MSELGRNLQRARISSGLSQEQVAYRSHLSRYTYQKLESGIARPGAPANPTLRTLVTVARILAVEVSQILPAAAPDLPEP
ncbi:helix-turn-helix domain-containing protein [Microbacterium ureisolvens]|uniref:helix-turn-helix domain-containing protein n=1 Tax=Microbacterium ureisolvens TaxID=2781186 RepID=UPI0027E2F7C4|nr:helix-turn-helix transcriptional regulator [Microbacterium ureisolvens]